MNPRFHPSLLPLDNQMEAFMQEHKNKIAGQGKAQPRIGSLCVGNEGVSGTVEGHGEPSAAVVPTGRSSQDENSQIGSSVGRAKQHPSEYQASPADSQYFPDKAEARFMHDVERIREANKSMPKKRFSLYGLIALLGVAAFVIWFVWFFVGSF